MAATTTCPALAGKTQTENAEPAPPRAGRATLVLRRTARYGRGFGTGSWGVIIRWPCGRHLVDARDEKFRNRQSWLVTGSRRVDRVVVKSFGLFLLKPARLASQNHCRVPSPDANALWRCLRPLPADRARLGGGRRFLHLPTQATGYGPCTSGFYLLDAPAVFLFPSLTPADQLIQHRPPGTAPKKGCTSHHPFAYMNHIRPLLVQICR